MRIGLVAAEPSGDVLGSGLITAIKERVPEATFEGIGGPRMIAAGMDSWFPMEKLSVMGLVEVLKHLPELVSIRKKLVARWKKNPPDLFIGIDAPDFNLGLECKLREAQIPVAHYVCPTVWAWRPGRVKKIRAAADLILTIFPFEKSFLDQHGVKAEYVGHSLAQEYPLEPDRNWARDRLGLTGEKQVLALLPGSRGSEVTTLTRPFLQAAMSCKEDIPGLSVLTPLANEKTADLFEQQRRQYAPDLGVRIIKGDTRTALTAADVALVASGTATFEALLCKRPMVVGYKLHWLTHYLLATFNMLKIENVAMANLLSEEALAPEFIQDRCEPEYLVPALLNFFRNRMAVEKIESRYRKIHQELILDTNGTAAEAVLSLLERA